jgi:hypothetical protein
MKKILFAILLLYVSVFIFSKSSYAVEETWTDQSLYCWRAAVDMARGWDDCIPDQYKQCGAEGKVNLEGYTGAAFDTTLYTVSGKIIGGISTFCTDERAKSLSNKSAVGGISTLIAGMYQNPPASGIYYARTLFEDIGFAEPAYAQGIGYSSLRALQPIWIMFRNIAYMIIVVILVAIGFMVMFRMKINPQTVISIQNSLPNIVVTLIVITFSYAIAGFMIDLMYFSISMIVSIFGQAGALVNGSVQELQTYYLNANLGNLIGSFYAGEHTQALFWAIFSPNFENAALGIVTGAVSGILGGIAFIIVALAILFIIVRVFFLLLTSYIQIILSIIFAPIFLLSGAIPGRSAFGNWIKGLLGNLIIFPALVTLLIISQWLASNVEILEKKSTANEIPIWTPPFMTGTSGEVDIVIGLISFGFMMLIPSLLTQIKGVFAPKSALPISPAMIFAPIQQTVGTISSLGQQKYYMSTLKGLVPFGKKQ